MNHLNTAMLVSVVFGLASIPVITTTVSDSHAATAALLAGINVSEAESMPGSESVSYSHDKIEREVSTPYGKFRYTATPDKIIQELEKPDRKTMIVQTFNRTTWVIETKEGVLNITQTPFEIKERFTNPYGFMEKIRENGEERITWQGADFESINSSYEKLKSMLEEDSIKIVQMFTGVRVEITKIKVKDEEFVELENRGSEDINLKGWSIGDEKHRYTFEEFELRAGECVRIYSNYDSCNETQRSDGCAVLCWEEQENKGVWNDTEGDEALLFDAEGSLVDRCEYSASDVSGEYAYC